MQLSIVIVNYNVKYFLEQCLYSVEKAIANIDAEVFVVDNNSADGSCLMVQEKFPWVKLIANTENYGFSYANNQAIRQSKGKYVLLLNPDTVVKEDTFLKTVGYMEANPDAGALGVKMIDGKGNFLPESKRGLPEPWVAFYKIFGLSKLFPKSKKFGQYHLSFLDKDENHEIDVLCGAFMLMRADALEKVGLLDEEYFMYGEDIDLSYRIQQGGYKVIYFADTTIIHYKGESTKKGSVNYVRIFYNAMIIFARKHFSKQGAGLYVFIIKIAIYLRALLAIIRRMVQQVFLPVSDWLLLILGYELSTNVWEMVRYEPGYYSDDYRWKVIPIYGIFTVIVLWINGAYDATPRLRSIVKSCIASTLLILLTYSVLPESLRFSRILLLLGGVWSVTAIPLFRTAISKYVGGKFQLFTENKKKRAIVGTPNEVERVKSVMNQSGVIAKHFFTIHIKTEKQVDHDSYIGTIDRLSELVTIHKLDELIFCSADITSSAIMDYMLQLAPFDLEFKIAPPESVSVIGSNSIDTAGDMYVIQMNALTLPANRRQKRLFDMIVSLILVPLIPVLLFLQKKPSGLMGNIVNVLLGKSSWVSINSKNKGNNLKRGVLNPADQFDIVLDEKQQEQVNLNYSRNYSPLKDLELLLKGYRNLGNPTR
ncbi:glycosyltransferase [Prolixibacteraceae bacterium JC049]|nr:glycosyltransferase [Prolixibacteraceae bacterium JC049]